LIHVAKAAFTLSHSNAIPERGFSVKLTAARKAHSECLLYLEEQKAAELHKAVELEKELEEQRQLKNK